MPQTKAKHHEDGPGKGIELLTQSSEPIAMTSRHLTHKRLERWIRLQQFVFGLPDDYSYSVCISQRNGKSVARTLVKVGWMSWYGSGRGADPQHSLAVALLDSSEAMSANTSAAFLHRVRRWLWSKILLLRWRPSGFAKSKPEKRDSDLLAS